MEKFLTEKLKFAYRQLWAYRQLPTFFKQLFSFSPKKVIAAIVAIAEMFGLMIFDAPTTPRGEALDMSGYELVFEDEFDGTQLNTDVWEYRASGARRGGFNSESQVRVENGNLIITGDYQEDGTYGAGWYGGMIRLKEKYCKGYFEIRCKIDKGDGFWSAFWLQADDPYTASSSKGGVGGAEIDIFESVGRPTVFNKKSVSQTIHCAGVDGVQEGFQSRTFGEFKVDDPFDEYNTYGVMWNEDEYIFYINGIETVRSSFGNGVSQVPEEVIVSLEIPGEEDLSKLDKDTYCTEFIVDYVRIYQLP